MVSEEAVAQEVKHALREQHMKKRPCAVVIPAESAIVRRLTVPYMSPEQLRVNLPYEFHDFVQGDKDQYFYDYAVVAGGRAARAKWERGAAHPGPAGGSYPEGDHRRLSPDAAPGGDEAGAGGA